MNHDLFEDVARFRAKVDVRTEDACWPFFGARVPAGGYGRALLNGKLVAAHRIAYMLANGNIPDGLDVMHSCDNPPCCNPRHLSASTAQRNMADMRAKGRHKDTGSKLTEQQAREVLSRKGKERAADVAAQFGLTVGSVHNIWIGAAWKQLQACDQPFR